MLEGIRARRHERLLLNGVTGSGKTEVYLRAVAQVLEQGRSAIVLVPEIALTPQTAGRFAERFGDRVAVMHSQLGLGERYDEWQRLRRGEARVCVGPRSAVFAPVRDLGLIVVDEEHDSAYKQESDPRYDARRVAEHRAEQAQAVLLCGSATPRPESWRRLRRLDLPERVDGRRLPPVELIDMRESPRALHRCTREALDEVKRSGGKAIVLVNRRGWSPFVVCRNCGKTWMCPRCDVTLTLHRDGDSQALRCHHCGHGEPVPSSCPDCRSTAVARHGTGTQRLEAELREALAPLPVFRLDSDAARRKSGIAEVLRDFERASSGILVGTQMVAQGHDFPEVSLAVVQDADATLRFPDFRSEERTFSLVAQLAGRSGRGPARRPGARADDVSGGRLPSPRRGARRRGLPRARSWSVAARSATRRSPISSGSSRRLATQAAADAARERVGAARRGGRPQAARARRRCSALKDRSRSMLLMKTRERARRGRRRRRCRQGGRRRERRLRDVSLSVDVDPQ